MLCGAVVRACPGTQTTPRIPCDWGQAIQTAPPPTSNSPAWLFPSRGWDSLCCQLLGRLGTPSRWDRDSPTLKAMQLPRGLMDSWIPVGSPRPVAPGRTLQPESRASDAPAAVEASSWMKTGHGSSRGVLCTFPKEEAHLARCRSSQGTGAQRGLLPTVLLTWQGTRSLDPSCQKQQTEWHSTSWNSAVSKLSPPGVPPMCPCGGTEGGQL